MTPVTEGAKRLTGEPIAPYPHSVGPSSFRGTVEQASPGRSGEPTTKTWHGGSTGRGCAAGRSCGLAPTGSAWPSHGRGRRAARCDGDDRPVGVDHRRWLQGRSPRRAFSRRLRGPWAVGASGLLVSIRASQHEARPADPRKVRGRARTIWIGRSETFLEAEANAQLVVSRRWRSAVEGFDLGEEAAALAGADAPVVVGGVLLDGELLAGLAAEGVA